MTGNAWRNYGSIGVKYRIQEHNDTLFSSAIELRVDNLEISSLRFYLQRVTAAIIGILALNFFSDNTTAP